MNDQFKGYLAIVLGCIVVLCIVLIGAFAITITIPMFIYWAGLFEYNRGKEKTAWFYWISALLILLYGSYNIAEYFFLAKYQIYMSTVFIALIITYISYLQYQVLKKYREKSQ